METTQNQKRAILAGIVLFVIVAGWITLWMTITHMDGIALLGWINGLCASDVQAVQDRPAFYSTEHLEWCSTMRSHYKRIQREYRIKTTTAPIFSDVMPEEWNLAAQGSPGKWRVLILRLYGLDTKIDGFPITRKLLDTIPGCSTAMFSDVGASHTPTNEKTQSVILEPGRELAPHAGPNHGVLRYHLALEVPRDTTNCNLSVANEMRHWYEGQDLLFDDTLVHSAKNLTSENRVVLFVDILRPLDSPWRSNLNGWFHRYIAPNTLHIRSAVKRVDEFATTLTPDGTQTTGRLTEGGSGVDPAGLAVHLNTSRLSMTEDPTTLDTDAFFPEEDSDRLQK